MAKTAKKPAASIGRLSLKECETELAKIAKRLEEIRGRFQQIQPPRMPPPSSGPSLGGSEWDPLTGAGDEYRRAALSADPEALLEIQRESERLGAEEVQLLHRRDAVRHRLETLKATAAKKAAPERAKQYAAALEDSLNRFDRALLELADAAADIGIFTRELEAQRELTGGTPYWDPRVLRRTWAFEAAGPLLTSTQLLRERVTTRALNPVHRSELTGTSGVLPRWINDAMKRLPPPEDSLIGRLRKRITTSTNFSSFARGERDEREVARDFATARVKAICAEEFDRLDDGDELAVDAVLERMTAGGRKVPREEASRWWSGK